MATFTIDNLQTRKKEAFNWQQRRHQEWTENYELYRDKVIINRLTQRQSVNVPLMKETLKTIKSNIDDAPDITFEEKGNYGQKEIFLNEYWKDFLIKSKLEIKDVIDKQQVLLYGRSFKKLNIIDGEPYVEIIDPQDILVDRYCDPADIDTANTVIHQHIYRKLSDIEKNSLYDKEAINRLKAFYATKQGLIKSEQVVQSMQEANKRMSEMGVPDIDSPILGETYLELNEYFIKDGGDLIVCTVADQEILMQKPLMKILNINFLPLDTWADDIERTDFWSDGVADIVRTPNKILNAWFSQLVENRTLRNFGMNYYDNTAEGFNPQTFEPVPFGWYPMPGDPNKLVKRVDIPELSESLDEMQFIISMVERSTAATATEKGEQNRGNVTLGEIQLITAKANERITSIAKFYRLSWKSFGEKWMKLVVANSDKLKTVKLYKKSYKGNFFEQEVSPKEFASEAGYDVKVMTTSEQEQAEMTTIQKFTAVMAQFQGNIPLQKIYQKKLLGLLDISPEEEKEVMDFAEQNPINPMMAGQPEQGQPALNPAPMPAMAGMPA